MNSKIAMSGLSILASFAIMGGATFAFFSSSATSTGNVFAAGNLVLQVDDANEANAAAVSASLNFTDLAPGVTSTKQYISLHKSGSLDIAEVELGATKTADDADPDLLENVINLTVTTGDDNTCTTNGVDRTAAIAGATGNSLLPLTLGELIASDYDALPGLGSDYFVCFQGTMDATAGDEYQGDSVTVTMDFKGNQDVSQ